MSIFSFLSYESLKARYWRLPDKPRLVRKGREYIDPSKPLYSALLTDFSFVFALKATLVLHTVIIIAAFRFSMTLESALRWFLVTDLVFLMFVSLPMIIIGLVKNELRSEYTKRLGHILKDFLICCGIFLIILGAYLGTLVALSLERLSAETVLVFKGVLLAVELSCIAALIAGLTSVPFLIICHFRFKKEA